MDTGVDQYKDALKRSALVHALIGTFSSDTAHSESDAVLFPIWRDALIAVMDEAERQEFEDLSDADKQNLYPDAALHSFTSFLREFRNVYRRLNKVSLQ